MQFEKTKEGATCSDASRPFLFQGCNSSETVTSSKPRWRSKSMTCGNASARYASRGRWTD